MFFPAAPVFWLIAHFVGGGRILFAIWVLLLAWTVHISCQLDRRERLDVNPAANAKANFWKWFAIDLIVICGVTYLFDLSTVWLAFFVVVPLALRKRVIAYMMARQ